jgi:benzoyl-CoA reductase/2-hydroxyglutaryl-CoA dehydratase subunit BcrC/BadD/HgdB
MGCCSGTPKPPGPSCDPRQQAQPCASGKRTRISPRFARMVPHALEHARAAKAAGRPVVGILCEFTPREVILAAGGVPVCLCGGSADTIPAAEADLPANLCPLIKSTWGYELTGGNPFLELLDLVVAETTCDGKKKMYELMAERRPVHVLELPQKPADPEARTHWRAEVAKLAQLLRQRFQVPLGDPELRAAIAVMERERGLRRGLAELLAAEAPPLTGRDLLDLKSIASGIPCDLAEYERLLRELPGRPCPLPGATRVLLTGVPLPHGAERVLDLIEGSGGLVVAQENCTGLKPLHLAVDAQAADPLTAIADTYLHLPCSVMTRNQGRFELLRELAARYRPQCVVEVVWQACLTYDVESALVRRFCEQELRIPYLRIGTDYGPSDSARIQVRLEALFEQVQAGCHRS